MSRVTKSSIVTISKRAVNFPPRCLSCKRALHDGRIRLTKFWTPTGGVFDKFKMNDKDSNWKLYKAGFLRAVYPGINQLLPLGLRVQEKLESLLDRHMRQIGASKLSLSSLSSAALWEKSGRLNRSNEFFKITDRRKIHFLLAPTHEEEITLIAAGLVHSYKDLPLRLYQISRKYRDEQRPREGLLRGREFLMKDLYTFDYNTTEAMKTYNEVREAYSSFFRDLKIPIIEAEADSGNMGGNLSHEYHISSEKGEDTVISCSSCDYVANEELAESGLRPSDVESDIHKSVDPSDITIWRGVTKSALTSVNVHYPGSGDRLLGKSRNDREINLHLLRSLVPEIDLTKFSAAVPRQSTKTPETRSLQTVKSSLREIHIFDHRVPSSYIEQLQSSASPRSDVNVKYWTTHPTTGGGINMRRILSGDPCPRCSDGTLETTTAVELGHTFFLGTRYSSIFNANVAIDPALLPPELDLEKDVKIQETTVSRVTSLREPRPKTSMTAVVPLQMGCHGIGVSRMIAAVADNLADSKGLNWPRLIAPFEVVVVNAPGQELDAEGFYDDLTQPINGESIDAILDDRDRELPWKLGDADMIGYPVIVVVGKSWKVDRNCEVQCRRLGLKEMVPPEKLRGFVDGLLRKL